MESESDSAEHEMELADDSDNEQEEDEEDEGEQDDQEEEEDKDEEYDGEAQDEQYNDNNQQEATREAEEEEEASCDPQPDSQLCSPLRSPYEFLAAVSMATSGNEACFYTNIKSFPDCSNIMPISNRLQTMANRAGVTIVSSTQTFEPECGVSKATLFFNDNTWKTILGPSRAHIKISKTLKRLVQMNKVDSVPLFHLVSQFPKSVRVGLFGGVGEGKSTLVESVFGTDVSTKSNESGSQTSWIHEFTFTKSDKYKLRATFVSKEEINRLRKDCEDDFIEHGKLKEMKKEVRSYFGNELLEAISQETSNLYLFVHRPSQVDDLERCYVDGLEMENFEDYQACLKTLQEQRTFVEAVYSEIPVSHKESYYIEDLTLIDLPGSNDTNTNRAKMIEKIISEVDVIIYVSNQRNNMTAKTIEKRLFKYGMDSMESKRS